MSYAVIRKKKRNHQTMERKDYKLSDFDLVKTIGRGTFGRVCLAFHRPSRTYHAMKILALRDVIKLEQVEQVRRERSLLSSLSHPGLLSLDWAGRDTRHLYLLTPFLSGGELFSYLRCAGNTRCRGCSC